MSVTLNLELSNGKLIDAFSRELASKEEKGSKFPEQFVTSGEFPFTTDDGKESKRTILLTTSSYYEFPGDVREYSSFDAAKHKSLTDIHSVELDAKKPTDFHIHWFSGHTSIKSKAAAGLNLLKQMVSKAEFSDFIKTKTYRCANLTERWQWCFVLNRLIRNVWQLQCEGKIIKSPEVYQRHAFVVKGKQNRVFLVSHGWLYNIEVTYHPTTLGGLKWARPVSSLKCLSVVASEPKLEITFDNAEMKVDEAHMGSKKDADSSKSQVYVFFNVEQRDAMVDKLKQLYLYNTRGAKKLLVKSDNKFDDEKTAGTPGREDRLMSASKAPIIQGRLIKLTTGWTLGGKHERLIKLLPDGIIEWSENENATKVYREVVLGLNVDPKGLASATKKLDPAKQASAFQVKSSGKSLILLADNPEEKVRWEGKINEVLKELEKKKKEQAEKEKQEKEKQIKDKQAKEKEKAAAKGKK